MNCQKAEKVLFLFFDGEIEDDLIEVFKAHLSHCPDCAHRLDFTRKFLVIIRQRCVRQVAPSRLRARILTSLPHRKEWN